jgi:hypothetical protein
MKYKFSVIACARWENPYILEWIAYYQAIGFDHIYLYCNDDDPAEMHDLVRPLTQGFAPFVTFYAYRHQGHQSIMYTHFLLHHRTESEWISFLDIDEFLRLPPGQNIKTFMQRYESFADCLMFNNIWFGPGGHKSPPPGSVLRNFTQREDAIHCLTKYVARSDLFASAQFLDHTLPLWYWHHLASIPGPKFRAVNVLGEDMADYYAGFPERPTAWVNESPRKWRILAIAIIHHHVFRSEQAFHDRINRGRGGNFGNQSLWVGVPEAANFPALLARLNAKTDTRLAQFWATLQSKALGQAAFPHPSGDLISPGKIATQSSTCEWSINPTPEADATGALGGDFNGVPKFHTDLEENPWWQVDLGAPALIREIVIYNTTNEFADRFQNFKIETSPDGGAWSEICRKEDSQTVGGINSRPFFWQPKPPARGKFVRVTLLGRNFLHLERVEIYGQVNAA